MLDGVVHLAELDLSVIVAVNEVEDVGTDLLLSEMAISVGISLSEFFLEFSSPLFFWSCGVTKIFHGVFVGFLGFIKAQSVVTVLVEVFPDFLDVRDFLGEGEELAKGHFLVLLHEEVVDVWETMGLNGLPDLIS